MSVTALVVGSGVTTDEALAAAGEADLLISYDWRLGVELRARTGRPVEIIDVTGRITPIEERAWAATVSLVEGLGVGRSAPSATVLRASRRALFLEVFMPASLALEKAERVRMLAPGARIECAGLTDVERAALGVPPLAEPAPVQSQAPRRSLYRRLRGRAGALRARRREARARAEERRRLRALASAEIEQARQALASRGDSPVAVVLVAVDVHIDLFRTAIASLRRRGWTVLMLSFNPARDFTDVAPALGVATALLQPILDAQDGVTLDAAIAEGVRAQLAYVARLMGAYGEFLSAVRPDVLLTVSEINPPVEAAAFAARALGIPTVNVQHGAITDLPRFSEFPFDAFCVFGEAYAEVLARRGTPADRLHVTGSPLADARVVSPPAGVSPSAHLSLLFAGGYSCATVGDAALHDTLAMVLAAAREDGEVDVRVKLHPLAEGHEAGYEGALGEYPDVSVTVSRDADLDALMRGCDCVITHASTVGIDAAAYHKPVILLSLPGDEDLLPLVAEGTALRARDTSGLVSRFAAVRTGAVISDADYERVRERYNFTPDGKAGERVADVCETLAGRVRT